MKPEIGCDFAAKAIREQENVQKPWEKLWKQPKNRLNSWKLVWCYGLKPGIIC